jgi:3-oxoacyl-[acyl-carrier protein] reductase
MTDIAIVTGASGGIGGAVARMIHEKAEGGLRLALHYRSGREAAEKLAGELPGSFLVQADLSRADDRERLAQEVLAQGAPYVLVNAAGDDRPHEPALSIEESSFDYLVGLNLKAPLFLMKRFAREMARSGSGVIVNITSVLARHAVVGSALYRVTKAALEAATRQFAMELGPRGVRVNAVAPGFIDTEMTGRLPEESRERLRQGIAAGSIGSPEAVAAAVCQIIDNDYINGAVLAVDGGIAA